MPSTERPNIEEGKRLLTLEELETRDLSWTQANVVSFRSDSHRRNDVPLTMRQKRQAAIVSITVPVDRLWDR